MRRAKFRGQHIELFCVVGEFAQARFQRDQQTYLIRVACQFNRLSPEFPYRRDRLYARISSAENIWFRPTVWHGRNLSA